MDENEVEEVYPEEVPAAGLNRWDLLRIATLPLAGLAQGTYLMLSQFHEYLIMQSQVHDDRVEAERLNKALR
jgi:hypothetical protein